MTASETLRTRKRVPPVAVSLPFCVAAVALVAWLRLDLLAGKIVPISTCLPLLICLWSRRIWQLYGVAAALTLIAVVKVFWLLPPSMFASTSEFTIITSHVADIWIIVAALHGVELARERDETKNAELLDFNARLETTNEELAATNEELAAREEEISRQNEELQSQAEELEQQAEELRQQAEEMEQQSAELQEVNQELVRKERGLQTLLDTGRWLRGGADEAGVLNGVCQAALEVLEREIEGAAITAEEGGSLSLKGDAGFGLRGALVPDLAYERSFSSLVLESGRPACLEDTASRPDMRLPGPGAGQPFRSVLAAPIWCGGRPVAVLEVYSTQPRSWSDHEFRIVEWLAAQAAMALQSMQYQQELEGRRRAAEEASIQKTRFLAAVSHDVRTPANAMSLLAELIERCSADPARHHQIPGMARDLLANARAMIELVSDVLDLTRYDSGRLDLEVTEFSLCELLRAKVQQAQPLAEQKGLTIQTRLPERDIRIASDRLKLSRVLANLVSNAVKFTDRGEVRVECHHNGDGHIAVEVHDTGIGIPAEHLGGVFDEFFQLRNPERNREKGAGLGLAICRRLIDGLGFRVDVKSVLGAGSSFSVLIPESCLVNGSGGGDAAVVAGSTDGTGRPLEDLSVLLVEDHETARRITAELLEAEGARVATAATGREALRLLDQGGHQVLLLDLNLPDFDGTEILRSLQSVPRPDLRWILVVSADVRPERVAEVKRLGAHALIAKPVSTEKIAAAIAAAAVHADQPASSN